MSYSSQSAFVGSVCVALALITTALVSPAARAVPAFARKTGLACTACHEVWPRLNDFGQQYRDNGYRLKKDRDLPVQQDSSYWPITFRTTAGYQWLQQHLVPTDGDPAATQPGSTTAQTGTFGFTGLDIFSVGTLGDHLSYLITYTPGLTTAGFQLSPSNGDLESAWIGFNDVLGTSYLNFRVGKHALDLPIDEHRQITLTSGYNVYHFHPAGSRVSWSPGDNQPGLELYGHSDLSRLRYSVSLVNERDADVLSNNLVSTPVVWGHFTAQHVPASGIVASIKGGLFGSIGWHPTGAETITPAGGTPGPVQGTGNTHKKHYRYGAEGHVQLFSLVNPLTFTGVVWGSTEDAELTPGATQDAKFFGGFGEAVYTHNQRLSLIARYERIRTTQAAVATSTQANGDLTSFTAAIRHTFEITNRAGAALQLELTRSVVSRDGSLPETFTGLAAFDFAM